MNNIITQRRTFRLRLFLFFSFLCFLLNTASIIYVKIVSIKIVLDRDVYCSQTHSMLAVLCYIVHIFTISYPYTSSTPVLHSAIKIALWIPGFVSNKDFQNSVHKNPPFATKLLSKEIFTCTGIRSVARGRIGQIKMHGHFSFVKPQFGVRKFVMHL